MITVAIKFVQTNKEKLMSTKENEAEYSEDEEQLEKTKAGESNQTTNQIF